MATWEIPKELGLFNVDFLTVAIYHMGGLYYYPDRPSKTISIGDLKSYVGFQKVASEPL